MKRQLFIGLLVVSFLNVTACAHKALLKDDAGKPISEQEVSAKKSNKNFLLFTIGGGALSFGASFFIGSLIDRGADSANQSALWITTGIGTAAGLLYFAHQGKVRDFNYAIEEIKAERIKSVASELDKERQRRAMIEKQKRELIEARKRQEAERRKLLEKLKKQKRQNEG